MEIPLRRVYMKALYEKIKPLYAPSAPLSIFNYFVAENLKLPLRLPRRVSTNATK